MDELNLPIIKKLYELYKLLYDYRASIPKLDRYAIWQRCDELVLDILENFLSAAYAQNLEKIAILKNASKKLNILRILVRLVKDIKAIDGKKYITLQEFINEIGRMLGGWMRSGN